MEHQSGWTLGSLLRRFFATIFWIIVAAIILLEEWLWDPLTRAMQRLAQLPVMRAMSRALAALPPYGAATIFLVPLLLLIPVKILALWFIGRGHVMSGLIVFALAKVVGTALVTWIFSFTRASLLTLPWFATLFDYVADLRNQVLAWITGLPGYQAIRKWLRRCRMQLLRWTDRR